MSVSYAVVVAGSNVAVTGLHMYVPLLRESGA